jgi:3-oxoadipate enol-lactonase/4-carboxymuconolactone decarboxylase
MKGGKMQFAKINGTVLRYRVCGDPHGPAIIFANSLGTDLTIWDPILPLLPAGYALVGYDKRGHGLSALHNGPLSIETLADDLIALADHLNLPEFVVCGLSVGGLIAQAVAARAPNRLRGLILSDTGAQIGPVEVWEDRIAKVNAHGMEPLADPVMERWFTAGFRAANPDVVAGYREMVARMPAQGYAMMSAAIRDADFHESTAKITTPTLCMVGQDDAATPPALMRKLAGLIAGAEYHEIPDCGHIPPVQQPAACAALITGFMASLDTPSTANAGPSRAYRAGMVQRRKVLGDAHVDAATARATTLDERFQTFITESAWGRVWSGRHFTLRERSLITLALLAALGQDDEVAMHLRAAANTGATPDDIAEALMHVAIYAGVPRANHALKIAKSIFDNQQESR